MRVLTAVLGIAGVRFRIRTPFAPWHGSRESDATQLYCKSYDPGPLSPPPLPQILNVIGGAFCRKAKTAMANAQNSGPAAATEVTVSM